MDWSINFKWQYDYAKKQLQNLNNYDADWQSTIQALKDLLDPGGFDGTKASALDTLRTKAHKAGGKRVSIDLGLLNAVNAFNDGVASISDAAKLRASALKFLTHVYLLHTSGKRSLWIHSLPNEFLHWPSIHFNSWVSTDAALKDLLKSNREHFSEAHKKDLASAAQYALAWCHKTNMILAQAASKSDKGKDGALAIVKRWFADPATTEADLNKYIATLSAGFKSITATLSKGSMILTDWVPLRSASTEEEIRFLNSEAFTFASRYEGLDVVYIEKSFFVDHPGNVLKGSKNWTRILVHELTHLVCGTEDVTRGQARYAWYGIGPHAGFPGSDAVRNADSWAFFCTDCAGLLTDGERNQALKIV